MLMLLEPPFGRAAGADGASSPWSVRTCMRITSFRCLSVSGKRRSGAGEQRRLRRGVDLRDEGQDLAASLQGGVGRDQDSGSARREVHREPDEAFAGHGEAAIVVDEVPLELVELPGEAAVALRAWRFEEGDAGDDAGAPFEEAGKQEEVDVAGPPHRLESGAEGRLFTLREVGRERHAHSDGTR